MFKQKIGIVGIPILYNNKYVIYYCIGAEGESRTRTGCPTGV